RDAGEPALRGRGLGHPQRDQAAVLQTRDRDVAFGGVDHALEDLPLGVGGPVLELRHALLCPPETDVRRAVRTTSCCALTGADGGSTGRSADHGLAWLHG